MLVYVKKVDCACAGHKALLRTMQKVITLTKDGYYVLGDGAYAVRKEDVEVSPFSVGDKVKTNLKCCCNQCTKLRERPGVITWVEYDEMWRYMVDNGLMRYIAEDLYLSPPEETMIKITVNGRTVEIGPYPCKVIDGTTYIAVDSEGYLSILGT